MHAKNFIARLFLGVRQIISSFDYSMGDAFQKPNDESETEKERKIEDIYQHIYNIDK